MANSRPTGAIFLALTPVALRAPSVSARKQPVSREQRKPVKTLDGCRSLIHTEKALRRFAPHLIAINRND